MASNKPSIKRYIITAAQEEVETSNNGKVKRLHSPLHRNFADNIDTYAKRLRAEVMVIPYARGKYNGGGYLLTSGIAKRGWKVITRDQKICKHLELRLFWVSGQQINPLTGLSRFVASNVSAILGSPKQHMMPVPNQSSLPKVLLSTGTATVPNYKASRQGGIAKLDHTYGFVYVETDGTYFHFRQVEADTNGNFCDLDREVRDGRIGKATADIALGDIHTGSHDPAVLEAGRRLAKRVKAKHVIAHDLFDGKSVNHHEAHKYISQAKDYMSMDLTEELMKCGKMLQYLTTFAPNVHVVKSNHDEFLDRYLDAGDYSHNPRNVRISALLASAMAEGKDPLRVGIETVFNRVKGVHWLKRDESLVIRGFECGSHGDKGGNGSRGSYRQHRSNIGKCVTGHEHTPKKYGSVYVVGTSTWLRLNYTIGPSSWLNTHALIHSNGKVQLVNVLNGLFEFDLAFA